MGDGVDFQINGWGWSSYLSGVKTVGLICVRV